MRKRTSSAIIGLVLVVAACSSDGSPTETTVESAPDTTVAAAATPDGFCTEVVDVRNSVFSLQAYLEADLEEYVRQFGEVEAKMNGLEVHDEVSEDWDTMIEFMSAMGAIYKSVDLTDPEAANAAVAEQAGEVQELALEAESASTRIDDFIESHCGIELDGPGTG